MRTVRSIALPSLLLAVTACASGSSGSTAAPDRILAVDTDGSVIRRSTLDERAHASFAAPMDLVWRALMLSYADAGIAPTVSDRAQGRYGNSAVQLSRRLANRPVGDFFNCGSGMTGPYVESGRLTATVLTTVSAAADGSTKAMTIVSGSLRRNDGATSDPITCASTGALEELLRLGVESHLASTH